jgi:L-threonylcarbamoyladenylate synthase
MKVLKCPVFGTDTAYSPEKCISCPSITEACKILDRMGLVVYPTDTVYGLAGLALYPEAVDKVYKAKGRPGDTPITATVSSPEGLLELVDITIEQARFLGEITEPITWVLPAHEFVPERLLAGGINLGVRILTTGCAAAIVKRVGPITATSANVHGSRAARKVDDAIEQFGDKVDLYLDYGKTPIGIPSTIIEVDFVGETLKVKDIKIIREGAVSGEALEKRLLTGKKTTKKKKQT